MTTNLDGLPLKWVGILMLAGGILFWIGAFTPPWRQWMTSDLKEYLTIVGNNSVNWFFIHLTMVSGVILTMFSLQVFCHAVNFTSHGKMFSTIAASAYSFGTALLVISFAFRLTVTLWAANRFIETGVIEPWYNTWANWSNYIFALYMVLAYVSIGFLGLAIKDVSIIPSWAIGFCTFFGFLGAVGYMIKLPLFEPPLMIHLPLLVISFTLLLRLKLLHA